MLLYLIKDGLLVQLPLQGMWVEMDGIPSRDRFMLTEGREFVQRWISAKELV